MRSTRALTILRGLFALAGAKQDDNRSRSQLVFRLRERHTVDRKIAGAGQGCVDDSRPFLWRTLLDLKLQLFPIGIDHGVDIVVALRSSVQTERQGVGIVGQVRGWASAIPGHVLAPEPATAQRRMTLAKRNHVLKETEDVGIFLELAPVQPACFVVLVVWIVISELRVQKFVAGAEHGSSVREHQQAAEILDLLAAQGENRFGRAFVAFLAAVPAVIAVHAIGVVVTIGLVMFVVVGDEIIEREAVVGSDEVHALKSMIGIGAVVGK